MEAPMKPIKYFTSAVLCHLLPQTSGRKVFTPNALGIWDMEVSRDLIYLQVVNNLMWGTWLHIVGTIRQIMF